MPDTLDIMLPWHELRMRHNITHIRLRTDTTTGKIRLEENTAEGDLIQEFDTVADAVTYVQAFYGEVVQ